MLVAVCPLAGSHTGVIILMRKKHSKLNMAVMPKVLMVLLLDILATSVAFFLGLWFRFDFIYADISQYFIDGYQIGRAHV